MRESLASLLRPETAPVLPPFDRLAPPPSLNLLAAQVDAFTSAGDIVVDLHGRGAWVARTSIQGLRRAVECESNRLTRLLAEVVLRPPDLRHLDAAVQSLGASVRHERPLKQSIAALYASHCATCARAVSVDEYIWDAEAGMPIRKTYRCAYCRDQVGGGEVRQAEVDAEDVRRASDLPEGHGLALAELRSRFPTVDGHEELPGQLLELFVPRSLVALHAILQRIEGDLRASSIEAALRLAFLHALLPASRLNGYPGRMAGLRIVAGRVRPPASRQWRERHPWLLFEEGIRLVRGFVQRLELSPGQVQVRLGDHLVALADGTANTVLRIGAPEEWQAPAGPMPEGPRIRLVLTQAPLRWGVEALSHAYLAAALAIGRDAAAEIPIAPLLGGPTPRLTWSETAARLRRSLGAVRPMLAPEARVVVVLDPGGAESLVAAALAAVGAGLRLTDVDLSEESEGVGGTLTFSALGIGRLPLPRSRANVALPRAEVPPEDGPFQLADVEAEVGEVAVALLRARGEPVRFERLLGQILVALDGAGHLRRLIGTRTFRDTSSVDVPLDAGPSSDDTEDVTRGRPVEASWFGGTRRSARRQEARETSGVDQVGMLLELIEGELRRPGQQRVVELEPGHWWLGVKQDRLQAALPLADRVEWAVFSLLTTSGRLSETALYDRIASMFRGSDAPDAALVEACLESYRSIASTPELLVTNDELQARYQQHSAILGDILDYGHRLGLRVWVKRAEQTRTVGGRPLGERLTEQERNAYLPLILHAPLEALENVDAMWYLRGRLTFLFEVEWTAMLGEPLLRRGTRIPPVDELVRFLVIVPERTELVRFKLRRSAVLRQAIEEGNWYILKSNHLRRIVEQDGADLERLRPLLGLDPEIETAGEQLPLLLPSTTTTARRTS